MNKIYKIRNQCKKMCCFLLAVLFLCNVDYAFANSQATIDSSVNLSDVSTTTQTPTIQVPTITESTTTEQPIQSAQILHFYAMSSGTGRVGLTWTAKNGSAIGFRVYKKDATLQQESLLATININNIGTYEFEDTSLVLGQKYTYRLCPIYHVHDTDIEDLANATVDYVWEFPKPNLNTISYSKKTLKLSWSRMTGATGFEVYFSKKKKSGYKRIKTVENMQTSVAISNFKISSKGYFKIRAFSLTLENRKIYSKYSNIKQVIVYKQDYISKKFAKLKKQFPDGSYWNHVGMKGNNANGVTSRPCDHDSDGLDKCNSYDCPDGVLGYQCYGFVWMLSDKIYGKNAKIKNFSSFKKAKVGDVVRYGGHSIIIVEKHNNYVYAAECNVGGTCRIMWGRKVPKSELKGANYSRRY